MLHNNSNIAGADMSCTDNNEASFIQHKNIEEQMVDNGAAKSVSAQTPQQARKTEAALRVKDHRAKTREPVLKKYRGVYRSHGKWIAQVCDKRNIDGSENRVHLGTFPTAEMAAIAFDTSLLLMMKESSTIRMNFPQYAFVMQGVLQGCSPSKTPENIKHVAWKAAEALDRLIVPEIRAADGLDPVTSPDKKDQGSEDPIIVASHEQKDQRLEVAAPMSAAAASNIGVVPLLVKQRLNAANRAAGSIRTMDTNAHQFPAATQAEPEETINNINQQIQHGKPNSKTQEAPDSNISSFLLMPEPLQKCSIPVDTTEYHMNQQIHYGQSSSNSLSSFSFNHEALNDCSIAADGTRNNMKHQIEQHGQPSCDTSGAAYRNISCFSLMPESLHDRSKPTGTTETAALPTSILNVMGVEMESSGGVVEDYYRDYGELMQYPLRHSPQCVLLRPVPGVNIHPDYIWKRGKREPPVQK